MSQVLLRCFRRWQLIAQTGCKELGNNAGTATVELSLLLSLFGFPLLLGTVETSMLLHDSIEVSNAAHAGAMYGMMSSTFAADTAKIKAIAQADASDIGANLVVTPTSYYACSAAIDGAQYATEGAASAVCPSGAANHYLQFIQVVTSASITAPIQIAGLPKTLILSGSSVMEVEE
jgi:Flp pilus assembly protein TadG